MSVTGADLSAWNGLASHWIEHADRIAELTAGASDALVARLRPEPGQRLLDVASGVGDPALRLARMVRPTGQVTASDGVPGMCAALRQRAAERRLDNVTVLDMPAEELDLPPAAFDGACCRFGAMFFADPPEALRRMRGAVRPGGRLVLAVWAEKQANPYFTLAMDVLDQLGVAPVPQPPGIRNVFEFSAPGLLLGIARAAGWREAREDPAELSMALTEATPATLLDVLASLSGRVAERLALATPAQLTAARSATARLAPPFARDGHIVFPARILLVCGRA
jgi:SAM-dependent methyltransferase